MQQLTRKVQTARFAVMLCLATLTCTGYGGTTLDRIKQTGTVTIGYRTGSVPFSYTVEEGKPIGYAIDLCQRFVQAIGQAVGSKQLRINYVPVTSKTRIQAVVAGEADLECESTTNTAERRKLVSFSIAHYLTGARYAVLSTSNISGLSDFRGRKLASTVETSPLKMARAANAQYLVGAEIVDAPEHATALGWVLAGKVDGFVMDEVLLAGLIATQPDPSKLKIVGKYLTVEPLGIMMPRDDAELRNIVNTEMRRMISSGEAAALHERWFMNPIPPKNQSLGLPMPFLLRDFWRFPTDKLPD